MELIFSKMVINILGNILKGYLMDKESISGQTVMFIKVILIEDLNKVKESGNKNLKILTIILKLINMKVNIFKI